MSVRIPIRHKGALSSLGYNTRESSIDRERSLKLCLKKYGKKNLIDKLNAVAILNRNKNKRASQIFERDMKKVQRGL